MGNVRLAVGVEIPNHDMRRKSSGGRVGAPDGWTPTSELTTKIGFGQVKLAWEPMWAPGTGNYDQPAYPYGQGRATTMEVAAAVTSAAGAELWSPRSPAGQFFGAEQMNRDSTGYWYYRVKALVRGKLLSSPGSTPVNYTIGIDVWTANGGRKKRLCNINLPESEFDGTWKLRQSAVEVLDLSAWTAGPGTPNPDYATAFIAFAGGTNTAASILSVADITIETLGPVDQGTGAFQLHASPAPNSYYELSYPPSWEGMRQFRALSMGRQDVLPSGRVRTYDPSGGVRPLLFEFPHGLLTRTDYLKLWRMWRVNRGYPSNPDTLFGRPLPLLLIPNQPEFIWTQGVAKLAQGFYVDFANEEFPLIPTGKWQRNDEAGQIYEGTLRFRER